MNKYFELSKWEFRPIIYSTLLTFGLFILVSVLESAPQSFFIAGSFILYVILLLELFITANYYHVIHKKGTSTLYDLEHHKSIQYAHHIFLPTLAYLGIILFIFFNNQASTYFLMLVLNFIIFTILFQNIYAFYRHKFSLNKSTNYIYDFLSLILVFFLVNSTLHFTTSLQLDPLIGLIAFSLVIMLFTALLLARHAITKHSITISVINFVVLVFMYTFFVGSNTSYLAISLIITVTFQLYIFFINRHVERNVSREEILEYALVIMLIFSLIRFSGI